MSSKKSQISQSSDAQPQNIGVSASKADDKAGQTRLEIVALAAGGRGLAQQAGLVWFVPDALPGDLILARPVKRRKRFVEGRKIRLIKPSPLRRHPPCPFQGSCGGCPFMPLDEGVQREWKRRFVLDALHRIGGLEQPPVEQVRRPAEPFHYRNRVEFTLGVDASGTPTIGFHAGETGTGLVDVDRCMLQHDSANGLFANAREFLLNSRSVLRSLQRDGAEFRLTIRRSWANERMLVTLRETSVPFPAARELSRRLMSRHPEVSGVVRLKAMPGRRGGSSSSTLAGRPWLEERIGKIIFRTGADTFVQVSTPGATELVRLVTECAGRIEGLRILDLYGGVGVFGLSLLGAGAGMATVCDADGEAINCGRRSARRMGEKRVKFFQADAGRFMTSRRAGGSRPDVIVANPPRSGLDQNVVQEILRRQVPRLVLVGCDPATMARDLRQLVRGGYRLERIVPVDLFPQTVHIETVSLLVTEGAVRPR
jgi:23S rRNA (uracil1939-C5)-methyltransferase